MIRARVVWSQVEFSAEKTTTNVLLLMGTTLLDLDEVGSLDREPVEKIQR